MYSDYITENDDNSSPNPSLSCEDENQSKTSFFVCEDRIRRIVPFDRQELDSPSRKKQKLPDNQDIRSETRDAMRENVTITITRILPERVPLIPTLFSVQQEVSNNQNNHASPVLEKSSSNPSFTKEQNKQKAPQVTITRISPERAPFIPSSFSVQQEEVSNNQNHTSPVLEKSPPNPSFIREQQQNKQKAPQVDFESSSSTSHNFPFYIDPPIVVEWNEIENGTRNGIYPKFRKYYVVAKGRTPGIYLEWNDAQKQVSGFPHQRYEMKKNLLLALEMMKSA